MIRNRIFIAAALGLASASSFAQSTLAGHKIIAAPTIDGAIGDEEWKGIPAVEGLYDAVNGAAYTDGGKFWIAYDKDFVYFAAKLTESEPSRIRATEYRTNVGLSGDDFVELDLDLSGSLSAFNVFRVNPQGATNIQIAGGRAAKREWLGAMQAKGRITASGWECEARIPWQAMNVPRGGKRDLRFNFARFVAKNARILNTTFVPQTQAALTPTWSGVELPKPDFDRSIKLLPYGYSGYDPKSGGVFNGGLDMKTQLTDQITAVGSINPDFRNIENSILSLDFSRFERIANETRPFFQEGQQYSNSQIFLGQRIREFDAGINTYGRITDKTSFSVIGTQQFGHEGDVALNITHDPTPNTSVRVTATDLERPGLSNQAHLVRLSQNYGDYNLFLRSMGSRDTNRGTGQQNDINISYSKGGFSPFVGWSRADKNFAPRLGYVAEVDLQGPAVGFDYTRSFNRGKLRDYNVNVAYVTYDHTDGSFYRRELTMYGNFTINSGLNVLFAADQADFQGSKDSLYTYALSYPRGNPYNRISVQYDQGMQAGFPYHSIAVAGAYRPSKRLQFTLREQHVDYQGASDQTILTTAYDLGNDRSIASRLVRQDNHFNAYLAYQRSGNVGMEYFLILGDPNAQQYRNAITLKVVMPISIGKRKAAG